MKSNHPTRPWPRAAALAMLILLTGACGESGPEVAPELEERREEALRAACVSNELARRSEDELATLEQTMFGTQPDPAGATGSPANAAITFARAFQQHAQLRMAAYAQVDSALNHSPTREDSTRHAAAAAGFEIRSPEPGTVEANVIADYNRRFAALINDPDHPCNWQSELQEK